VVQGTRLVVEQGEPDGTEPPELEGPMAGPWHWHAAMEGAPQPHWQASWAISCAPTTDGIASTGPTRVRIARAM